MPVNDERLSMVQAEYPPILSTAQAAELLGLSTRTVMNMAADGRLPARRLPGSRKYQFFLKEIIEALDAHRVVPEPPAAKPEPAPPPRRPARRLLPRRPRRRPSAPPNAEPPNGRGQPSTQPSPGDSGRTTATIAATLTTAALAGPGRAPHAPGRRPPPALPAARHRPGAASPGSRASRRPTTPATTTPDPAAAAAPDAGPPARTARHPAEDACVSRASSLPQRQQLVAHVDHDVPLNEPACVDTTTGSRPRPMFGPPPATPAPAKQPLTLERGLLLHQAQLEPLAAQLVLELESLRHRCHGASRRRPYRERVAGLSGEP
jgi:excisionase family DNA binding protein